MVAPSAHDVVALLQTVQATGLVATFAVLRDFPADELPWRLHDGVLYVPDLDAGPWGRVLHAACAELLAGPRGAGGGGLVPLQGGRPVARATGR